MISTARPEYQFKGIGPIYKFKYEIDLFEYKALGFDPTVEITTSDSF
ncbi:hypothetical protein D1AOALGA4SA_2768 [Olavius algarvensis Delta 1 endosymbiont]|nr:hypothetical protein D1AOALGA4SA_2768 [Olavius algarvensis Delta 1 endosymbiont]